MAFRFLKAKIGTKIAIIYFVLGFLSLLALNLIWLLPSLKETRQNASAVQLEIAKRGVGEIEKFLEYKLSSLQGLTFFLNPQAEAGEAEVILKRFLQKDQAFFEASLINNQGEEKIKVSQFEIFAKSDLLSRSDEDYFKAAAGGSTFISKVYFSQNAEPFLIVAIPIFSSEKNIDGVLMAKLNLREIGQVISGMRVGDSSHAFLVDEQGRLIAHSNPSLVLKSVNLSEEGPVKYVVERRMMVDGLGPNDRYRNEQNEQFLLVGVPLEKLPWGLFIGQPEAKAYAGLTTKLTIFILISVLGGVATLLVGRWLGRYLASPLKRLGEGAKIIGGGDLDFRLNIKTGDEVEDVASTFNEMAAQLKESYFYLEKKVEERTRELKAQRDQLDKTAKRLIQRDIILGEARQKEDKALREANEAKKRAEEARMATLNILEDIDESRRAQEAEKNKVKAVIRSLTDGLIMLDQFGRVALINGQAEQIIKVKNENVLGKKIGEISSAAIKKIDDLLKEGEPLDKREIVFDENSQAIFEASSALVIGEEKKPLGSVIVLHDVTREKAIEKMKSEFVTIAAHQLRTPLSAVKWTLRLILDRDLGAISKEQEEILTKGYQSNERMINLINDLLNVARIEEGRFIYQLEEVSFSDLLKEVMESNQALTNMRNVKFDFKSPECALPKIKIDKEKIRLVLQNLLVNAVNYSPAGSLVTISYSCDKMNLAFFIKDQGMGIPKLQQSRIFTKFFRAENAMKMETEGSGLGLFIVKNIIEAHNGKVWFESEEGKGSTFYFSLPIN